MCVLIDSIFIPCPRAHTHGTNPIHTHPRRPSPNPSPIPRPPTPPHTTKQILKLWAELGAFEQSLKLSEGRKEFTFYDGPPFATGLPHYGQCGRRPVFVFWGRGGVVWYRSTERSDSLRPRIDVGKLEVQCTI